MTARGEAPLPVRLTPQVAGWTHSGFFSFQIPPPEARRAAALGSACHRQGETGKSVPQAHFLSPANPRAISSFMISLVPP